MQNQAQLYCDYNATGPLANGVLQAMLPFLEGQFANPSSTSEFAGPVRAAVEAARRQVTHLLGAQHPKQVVFTSGGTESIHAAFHQACQGVPPGGILAVSQTEHSGTFGAAQTWADRGWEVVRMPVDSNGLLDRKSLKELLAGGKVQLISVILANNETGAVLDLEGLAEEVHAAGAKLHLDAVQTPGKMPLDVQAWQADWVSLSGHKFGAPKGVGVLFEREPLNTQASPWMMGGSQESGRRGSTLNVAPIVGLGVAAQGAHAQVLDLQAQETRSELRDLFESEVVQGLPGAYVHAQRAPRVPNTSFLCLPGPDAQYLLPLLENQGVICSAGSACDASRWAPSPVLLAMGVSEDEASSSLRFSFGPGIDQDQAKRAAHILVESHRILQPEVPNR